MNLYRDDMAGVPAPSDFELEAADRRNRERRSKPKRRNEMSNRSESISSLASALAAAQGEFAAATKSRENPFLKNMYATLDDIIAAVRVPLSKNGLSFMQPFTSDDTGEYTLETILFHESGEWYSSKAVVPRFAGKGINELQAFGGALTYWRRYMLASMLGVSSEEDRDGNGKERVQKTQKKELPQPVIPAELTPEYIKEHPLPEDWTQLYTYAVSIGYNHRKHAVNVIDDMLDKDNKTVLAAWQVLIDHQLSKFAECAKETPQEPSPEELEF